MANADQGYDQSDYDRRFHRDFVFDGGFDDDEAGSTRSPLFIILSSVVLAAFAGVVWVAYQQGVRQGDHSGQIPVIAAVDGPVKVRPDQPGGTTVPDQDKEVYQRIAGGNDSVDVAPALAAPPETPVDMPAEPAGVPIEQSAAEAGEAALVTSPDAAIAPPSAEQVKAEEDARKKSAEIASEIEKVDPGAADAAAAKNAASGAFVVQIGAYRDDAEAAANWQALKSKHGDLMGALKPDIKRVDLGAKGVWYRLRVGPFAQRADAVAMCQVLQTRGGKCIVGEP